MYLLSGQRCGALFFNQTGTVTEESQSNSARVTENPIEDGSNINDHATLSARTLQISGVIATGWQDVANLERMWKEKDLVIYTGKFSFPLSVITSLSMKGSSINGRGVDFSLTLQEVKIAVAKKVTVSNQDTMNDLDNRQGSSEPEPANKGRQTPKTDPCSTEVYYEDYVKPFDQKKFVRPKPHPNKTYSGVTRTDAGREGSGVTIVV